MQADIPGVIGAHHIVTGKIQDAAEGIAQDGAAQMADMESLVGVGLGKLHHHLLIARAPAAPKSAPDNHPSTTRRAYSAVEKYRFR